MKKQAPAPKTEAKKQAPAPNIKQAEGKVQIRATEAGYLETGKVFSLPIKAANVLIEKGHGELINEENSK